MDMQNFVATVVFIYGLVLGSFFNVVGLRWVKDESIKGRSHCTKCGATLHWYNLIPLFSFLFQGGKCHNCKAKISWIYPIMELATGVSFLLSYLLYGLSIDFVINIIFMIFVLISAVTDYEDGYVLDKVVVPPTIVVVILTVVKLFMYQDNYILELNIIPSIVLFLLMLIAVKLEKLGSGDVLIIACTFLVHGLMMGSIAMFASSVVTLIFMLGFKTKKVRFIPFWAVGNILTYIFMLVINGGLFLI